MDRIKKDGAWAHIEDAKIAATAMHTTILIRIKENNEILRIEPLPT